MLKIWKGCLREGIVLVVDGEYPLIIISRIWALGAGSNVYWIWKKGSHDLCLDFGSSLSGSFAC
jgi:hypothetical protein